MFISPFNYIWTQILCSIFLKFSADDLINITDRMNGRSTLRYLNPCTPSFVDVNDDKLNEKRKDC